MIKKLKAKAKTSKKIAISDPDHLIPISCFGIVGFEDLLVRCIIGINPEERVMEQEILINLQVESDLSLVASADDLSNAICYASLAAFCTEQARKGQYHMVETLAYELVQKLKEHFQLSWVRVVIKKPSAILTASFAFVELEYGKKVSP